MTLSELSKKIFEVTTHGEFEELALDIFQVQAIENPVYKEYIRYLGINVSMVGNILEIPFLPIEFYRKKKVLSTENQVKMTFTSSGTSGDLNSIHYITDVSIYEESFKKGFEFFYGDVEDYCILALLPSYIERTGSSLIYMVDRLISETKSTNSGYYLHNHDDLIKKLTSLKEEKRKTILIGVTYALLDLAEKAELDLKNCIIMETGGMKGRRKEITRLEVHDKLITRFGVKTIHSEYGMTELLSQAYSKGKGVFNCPPWMRMMIRDLYDPFAYMDYGRPGGINVIDLANIYSCCFVETKDIGKANQDGSFEVMGRFDTSDIRGCNLLVD